MKNIPPFFNKFFLSNLPSKTNHATLLFSINQDVQVLKKIPVLPPLRTYAETFLKSKALPRQDQQQQQQQQQSEVRQENSSSAADTGATMTEVSDEDSSSTGTASGAVAVPVPVSDIIMDTTQTTQTLFEWIAANDNEHALGSLLDSCKRCLETFGEAFVESLKAEFQSIMKEAAAVEMREIKGLGDRLYTLEQLMLQMKKLVHEQNELAQGFNQNKVRVSNLNDDSVLPDLCTSHQEQLKVMLKNHNQLRDIRRRCTKVRVLFNRTVKCIKKKRIGLISLQISIAGKRGALRVDSPPAQADHHRREPRDRPTRQADAEQRVAASHAQALRYRAADTQRAPDVYERHRRGCTPTHLLPGLPHVGDQPRLSAAQRAQRGGGEATRVPEQVRRPLPRRPLPGPRGRAASVRHSGAVRL